VDDHVSDRELRDFVGHDLRAERAIVVDDHLSGCTGCRRRAARLGRVALRIGELRTGLTGRRRAQRSLR
jgi:hypothetical protein